MAEKFRRRVVTAWYRLSKPWVEDAYFLTGDAFNAVLIFYFMLVSHVIFLVSASGNDYLLSF